ncbi:FtsB family cell division protein [Arthrobacter sp. 35W]|uniref:FtsB family cell division protein n=1 Tax=Arthrobacter sp. 35W TaxID=1132441 RepID=UPI0003FE6803|nr:septum formation initiator family protein [Arthrobacter sp. 35W]
MATRRPKMPRAQQAPGSSDGAGSSTDTAAGQPGTSTASGAPAGATGGRAAASTPKGAAASAPAPAAGSRKSKAGTRAGNGRHPDGDNAAQGPAPVPARAFSGRLLALAVVLVTITILLAPAVHTFLQQRAEISALQADIAAKEKQQTELSTALSRWDDPAYIKQQARERVNMMMPGETGYWVFDNGGGSAAPADGAPAGTGQRPDGTNLPWVDGLWESIKRSAAP